MPVLLYARKRGHRETRVIELDSREAINIIRQNRKCGFQLGMIGSTNLNSVARVYGEFAPFRRVSSVDELLKPF